MAIKSGRVGVAPNQVDEYGRVVASDYLVDQLKEVLPPGVVAEPLHVTQNGLYKADEGKAFNPVMVGVDTTEFIDNMAKGLAPSGRISLGDSVTTVVNGAFAKKPITNVTGYYVTRVEDFGFQKCPNLATVNLPSVESIGAQSFQETPLTLINMPNLLYAGQSAFSSCASLTTISLPNFRKFNSSYTFRYCSVLEEVYLPNFAVGEAISVASNESFGSCSKLRIVDFGFVNAISANCFAFDTKFTTLILRKTSAIATLSNVNAFSNTPFKGTGGVVYVPSDLISIYENATNWSSLNITWRALEGSDYE